MIFGIGTDLVHIPRMQMLIEKHGDKIALKILSDAEFLVFQKSNNQAAFLAKRFAAKEAAAKALGTGFRDGLSLRHIEVSNNEMGKPELHFYQRGQALLDELNIGRSLLSLSDDKNYALAYVTLVERQYEQLPNN
ncbi:MAG: holo-ACP synthase [Gammaproteobacteria bacterium]|nr:holo-ACP synthase [Gammaproteobacteria bacterium]MDH5592730.1 holo-ACP synthase [Gammaproteobacteria bacterium]